jgi:hypothetical protein
MRRRDSGAFHPRPDEILNGLQLAMADGVIVVSVPLTDLIPGR